MLRVYEKINAFGEVAEFPNSTLPAELYSFAFDCKRMGNAPTITGTIMYPLCLDNYWSEDVYVEFKGEKYFIENVPSSSYSNQDARYKHDVTFVSERIKLEQIYFKDKINARNQKTVTEFSFFGDLDMFVEKLNISMASISQGGDNVGYKVVIDAGILTEEKNITIKNMYILQALQYAVEQYGVPYYIQDKIIHFGVCQTEIATPLKYGVDNALLSIQRENTNNKKITKITGVGSSENIPYYYPNFNESGEHLINTNPSTLESNIESINYHKIDPYTNLRNGGSATFYKATIGALGSDKEDKVDITVNGVTYPDVYSKDWQEKKTIENKSVSDGTNVGYHWESTVVISTEVKLLVIPKSYGTIYIDNQVSYTSEKYNGIIQNNAVTIKCYTKTNVPIELEYKNDNSIEVPDYVNLDRGLIVIITTEEKTLSWTSLAENPPTQTLLNVNFSYDTKYTNNKRKLIVKGTDIDEECYSDFYKVIELSLNNYSNTFTYSITREVAAYSNFYLDTAFKARFKGESEYQKFYPSINNITITDDKGKNYSPWLSDSKNVHCRNNNADTRVFTITMTSVSVNLRDTKVPTTIELSYSPDFHRVEKSYDWFKLYPKTTSTDERKYSVFGIKFKNTSIVSDGSVINFSPTINWIEPKQNLMPYKYRTTLGKEMFYMANNYTDDDGNYIKFPNSYNVDNISELVVEPKEDIKPTIVGIKNSAGKRIDMFADIAFDETDNNDEWITDADGNNQTLKHSFFFVKLRKTDGDDGFNLFEQSIENGEMVISMTDGHCGSCNFTIMVDDENYKNPVQVDENGDLVRDENGNVVIKTGSPQDIQQDTSQAEVWIALKKSEDDYGIILPDKGSGLVPTTDDKFVITNILLPNQYITKAEKKLEKELLAELLENNIDRFEYNIDFSRIFLAENKDITDSLNENSMVTIEYNGEEYKMYVSYYSYKMDSNTSLPNIKIEISKELTITKNKLQVLEDKVIKKVEYVSANANLDMQNVRGGSGKSNIKVVQETGSSKEHVMSQKAVTKAVDDVRMDTNDSLDEIRKKIQNINTTNVTVVQEMGLSDSEVMSQKAVTLEISSLGNLINSKIVQEKGGDFNKSMSQKAVTDALTIAKPIFSEIITTTIKWAVSTSAYENYDGTVVFVSGDKRFGYKVGTNYYRYWHSSAMYNTTVPKALTNTVFKNTSNNQDYIFDGTDLVLLTTSNGSSGSNITISQETGQSTTAVMSQKAVTTELDNLSNDLWKQGQNIIDLNNKFDNLKFESNGIADFKGFVYNVDVIFKGLSDIYVGEVYFDKAHGYFVYKYDDEYYAEWEGRVNYQDFDLATESYVPLSNVLFRYDDLYKWNGLDLVSVTFKSMILITYKDLNYLVNNSRLIQGMQYRITDYVTKCNSAGSVSGVTTTSAGHAFDIIVTADSNNTLNANARVCLHEGNTYFANSKLSEWVIKYDINNDTAKYQWAQTTDGRGVIYYMCDEFGNECCYDFKNILFNNKYTFSITRSGETKDNSLFGARCYENKIKGYYSSNKLILNNNVFDNTETWNNRNNSFAMNCYSNTFKNACSDIKLGIFCNNNKFASVSSNITFGNNCGNNELDTTKSYFKYVTLENGCSYNKITTSKATNSSNIPQNLHVLSGVLGTSSSINTITLNTVNNSYITKVAKNSSGVIKIYNEADLVG